jgi:hypothetical protein
MADRKVIFRYSWLIMGLLLVGASMVDFSSMCHPTEAGERTQDALMRTAAGGEGEAEPPVTAGFEGAHPSGQGDPGAPSADNPHGFSSNAEDDVYGERVLAARNQGRELDTDPNLQVSGAKPLTWQTLEDVTFKDVFIEEMGAYYWKPTFGPKVKALEGKPFYITGYIIPVDVDEDFYVLSRYPYANCFFCGGAGPESVVDLQFKGKSKRAYQTDERLTFVGTFHLNSDDIYQMNYILKDAVEFKP